MRNTKRNLMIMVPVLALTFFCVRANAAPQKAKQSQSEHTTKQETAADFNNYRVSYKVNEIQNARTVNSRSYTMVVKTGSSATVRIGSKVPYPINTAGQFQFQDIGMNIYCQLSRQDGRLIVHTRIDMSSVQGGPTHSPSESLPPVFSNFQMENNTVVTLGKPEFVGSADEVASNRRYVIEVTVTRAG